MLRPWTDAGWYRTTVAHHRVCPQVGRGTHGPGQRYGGSTCISGLKLPLSVAQTTPTPYGGWDGIKGCPNQSGQPLQCLPEMHYGRAARVSQAPPHRTHGNEATADPGRPRRSEARHMCTCTLRTGMRSNANSWS